ncbi:hypothetical protein [Arenibacter troitsensis]|uniref:Uncharacterized protein n=1 Tax=Arenibacter troitsensis TaxID=188872 RepID=A0A1X7KLR1_9FLAO|nr:hypothetical protein [Arenibacter troitsensis]SMG41980.1 hypothetical protein SAMN03080602_03099 [Arenibacter troitsensis]
MKKTSFLLFFRILALILFLSLGQFSLATTQEIKEVKSGVSGEIQTDHHLTYELPNSGHTMLLAEGNYKLPTVNELRPNLNLYVPNTISCLSILKEKELMSLKREVQIIASLDALTIIYPFHTFL